MNIIFENCKEEDFPEEVREAIRSTEYTKDAEEIHVYRNTIVDKYGWCWTVFKPGDRVVIPQVSEFVYNPDVKLRVLKGGKIVEIEDQEAYWRDYHTKTWKIDSIHPATYRMLNAVLSDKNGDKTICYTGDLRYE